jgi:MoxR-like ATPase
MSHVQTVTDQLVSNVEKVIVGKTEAVRLTVVGLLSQGHLLIEDVPGTGKTMLAKSRPCLQRVLRDR